MLPTMMARLPARVRAEDISAADAEEDAASDDATLRLPPPSPRAAAPETLPAAPNNDDRDGGNGGSCSNGGDCLDGGNRRDDDCSEKPCLLPAAAAAAPGGPMKSTAATAKPVKPAAAKPLKVLPRQRRGTTPPTVVAVTATPTPSMAYYCRDMRGKKHDIRALRKLRHRGVLKGMRWMRNFLRKQKYKALYEIGDDAPSIFFEIWYTSADSRIRAEAKGYAKELLSRMEKRLVHDKGPDYVPDRDDFFALMYLARIRHEMHDMLECEALLQCADRGWKHHGFKDTDHLFGYRVDALGAVDTDPWLGLLMRILIMEYNNLLFPRRYRLQWGMREALVAIKDLKLDGPGGDDFNSSFYLATHIIYALGAYSAIKTAERDCPWVYRYLRVSMRHWMKEGWRRAAQENANAALLKAAAEAAERGDGEQGGGSNRQQPRLDDEWIYVDIDGVSEIVDTFRGCGLTSASDRMVCQGSLYLLGTQKKDGSWPYWSAAGDANADKQRSSYDVLHPTWVAVQALRDRDFQLDRPEAEKWRVWINRLVKETDFASEPTHDSNWKNKGLRRGGAKHSKVKSKLITAVSRVRAVNRLKKKKKKKKIRTKRKGKETDGELAPAVHRTLNRSGT